MAYPETSPTRLWTRIIEDKLQTGRASDFSVEMSDSQALEQIGISAMDTLTKDVRR